jgi:hypothetical protein
VRDHAEELRQIGATVIAAGFSPAEPLAALAEMLEWPWPFLSDTERVLYRRLGFGRASYRAVYNRGTLRIYAQALRRGQRVPKPVEDTRQMGGDAVVRDGRAVRVFLPESPDDRVDVDTLVAVAREVAERGA